MFTHISSVVRSDFYRVSLISGIAVILFVLIFFRNPILVCICAAPVAVAIPLTLASFVLAKVSFTPMSVTYIAIIVGIGIDDAVHIISRARNRNSAEFRAILPEIGILITLTTLSTMIGFGSMMISGFYTIFSSGLVISLGVFFCLVFTILVVPAGCILSRSTLNN
jgi:predicted RND superfamily exporter protein